MAKISFITTYIGPLKHYARLLPYLRDRYSVEFLFIRPNDDRRKEMIAYCTEHNYPYHIIGIERQASSKFRVPIISPLKKRYEHSVACRRFLESQRPVKIVSHKAWLPYDIVFKVANKLGIETIVLQWSSDAGLVPVKKQTHSIMHRMYVWVLHVVSYLLDRGRADGVFGYSTAIPKKIGLFDTEKQREYESRGYSSKSITIVGPLDWQIAHDLKSKVIKDESYRNALLKKYDLSNNKLKVLVIVHRYYLVADQKYRMTMQEQIAHYYPLFQALRAAFSEEEADIVLKLHPTEVNLKDAYEPYKTLGVRLSYGEARADELLALADLYVAEPATSVNYMLQGTGTPAIFVNLSPLKILNERGRIFSITHVATNLENFKELLEKFKNGALEKQYDTARIQRNSIEKTIALITS